VNADGMVSPDLSDVLRRMTPIAPFPCPICDAPPQQREHVRGAELCNGCGFAIRLNERGELVYFAATNKNFPRAARRLAALLVPIVLVVGCATATPAPVTTPTPPLVLHETLSSDEQVCVLLDPWHYQRQFACVTVGELRRYIRQRTSAQLRP